jgi:glycosyltransferase involved in cell wall biosynthesis
MTSKSISKKILLVCSRLDMPGGIERSVVNIANLLHQHGHIVSILVLDETTDVFYPLHHGIEVHQAALKFGIGIKGSKFSRKISFLKDVYKLTGFFKKYQPNVVITTEYPFTIATWMATRGMTIRIISREAFHFEGLEKSNFWNKLIKWIYPKIDCIVCLNKDEETFYQKIGCKTAVIPNYILPQQVSQDKRQNILLTVCRLSKAKGADMIPLIAEKVFSKIDDWKWIVIGDGELEGFIESEIAERNLTQQVELIKPVGHLKEYYERISLYVSTSRFEGFPNVILEAMSFSVPVAAFDCPTGPRHIISQNEDGFLVEADNTKAMADAICDLIGNEEKRKGMGRKAQQNIERFSADVVYRLWEKLLEE